MTYLAARHTSGMSKSSETNKMHVSTYIPSGKSGPESTRSAVGLVDLPEVHFLIGVAEVVAITIADTLKQCCLRSAGAAV